MDSRIVFAGLLILFAFLSGFWLRRTGKPYSMVIITMHKLIGLATGVFLVVTVYRILKAALINQIEITAIVLTILFFIALVTTGGLLSAEKPLPEAVAKIHKIFPYLNVLSS